MTRMKRHLEEGRFLAGFSFDEEEQKLISGYPFLTRKPLIPILNLGEDQVHDPGVLEKLAEDFAENEFQWIAVSAKIEKNAIKYPVDKARGRSSKYTEL